MNLAVAAVMAPSTAPVSLGRVYTPGEKLSYSVRSNLHSETRQLGLQTWIPSDLDINYDYTMLVESIKADGIAVVRYQRPTITQVEGETFNSPPKKNVEKVGYDFRLTLSPFNEVIEMKDLKPTKESKKTVGSLNVRTPAGQASVQGIVGQFVSEVYRLSLFVGNFESALDFAPRTTFDKVAVGDTWQRTVGYQPQKLKGKDGQQAVQRLDFTYTYKGLVKSGKTKVHRVEGKMKFNTDLSEFVNQTYGVTSEQTGLKELPLALDTTIEFDLDAKTCHTLAARATSEGGFKVLVNQFDEPVQEQKLRGRTSLKLVKRSVSSAKK
jgi:hypothetical protein